MDKYLITTFGCQANMADSEKTSWVMENAGYKKAVDEKDLLSAKNPILIFNTCSVRQKAEDRIFGLNKKTELFKIQNSKLKIILTGCMMHYKEEELKERLPFFDHFVDIKNIDTLPKFIGHRNELKKTNVTTGLRSQSSGKILGRGESLIKRKTSKVSALIPISHGCDNFCTYCIVPLARGREISRPVEQILSDVKKAADGGAKEIWLLGQTVNSYKKTVNFADLLRLVNAIPGDFWIRFTSPHPKDFSDDLIKAMSECEKFAHYINLPVQSGNNTVLKRMGRPYTVARYKKLVKKIRQAMPDIAISTDVIVGFPGETRKQFEDTKKLFEEIKFDMAFLSEYSPRPKTAAAKAFKDDVPHKEKEKRKDEINEVLKKTSLENNKKLIGKTVKVLNGRTEGNKPIGIEGNQPKNKFALAKITKANTWSLKGKLL
ncbi:tRNA (N6-isopentenyl adenosine(37)-C2)-methylthiotransferase MiaB [Candidatus Parcubacteria bacterium]|nr:MAG: tRNA (N6-isopentenyl adenosine(37)-C2)-methylthiotransferase MiaB [Candidatus Parcubacteria bacterium]